MDMLVNENWASVKRVWHDKIRNIILFVFIKEFLELNFSCTTKLFLTLDRNKIKILFHNNLIQRQNGAIF